MISFPIAKINLGLEILGKRPDGYHSISSIFYPVLLKDVLEIIPSNKNQEQEVIISYSGLPIETGTSENLCLKAYRLLKNDFATLPKVQMHLHKVIPMGAGLGGGSSNAATTLLMLNKIFKLSLSITQLKEYALQLGSDCPFFIEAVPALAEGRGEKLQSIDLDLSAYSVLIVNPGIHIDTANAFAAIKPPYKNQSDLLKIIKQPLNSWKENLVNDFEKTAFTHHPQLKKIKEDLYFLGASYAAMSGSGSSLYGLFTKKPAATIKFPETYFYQWL